MAIEITIPRLGWTMEEGTFVEWRKSDGNSIRPGDTLYVLESEKAAEEIEALDAGILRIPPDGPKPGDKVLVGQVVGHLVAEGEPAPVARVQRQKPEAVASAGQTSEVFKDFGSLSGQTTREIAPASARRSQAASPRARRVAAELGIDRASLKGSGRDGRIRERDIREAAAAQPHGRLIPHTNMRRIIAARMVAGVTQAAPVTLVAKADATNLVRIRNQFKTETTSPNDIIPSYTDLVLRLTADALRQHPLLQAQWREDGLFVPSRIDIAVAVDTTAGLLAPVVRDVDKLTVRQIAAQSLELALHARTGRLTAGQMRDATFTVSNLGSLGIDAFTPILHLPQCAVLGVGRIVREPAVVDDRIVPRDVVTLCLTFDHRVVDGAPAARFLATLKAGLENLAP